MVQGLIQEDILRDINSADQSFNRVISLLDASPEPTQALADAYYERAYIKYIRTNNTAEYCPDREKAVALTRKLNTRSKLPKYLTALSFCYSDSPARLQQGLAVLNEALTLAESMQLGPAERGLIYNATAILYRKNQLYSQAYEYSELAYDQWKSIGALPSMDNQQHNLLTNAIGMGDLDKAELHGKELFALADAAPEYKDFRFFANLDTGLVAFARNDLPRAIRLFEEARREERNTEEAAFIAANRAQLAAAYFLHGDVDAALREAAAVTQIARVRVPRSGPEAVGAGLAAIQRQASRASHAGAVFAVSRATEEAMGIPGELHARPCPASQQPHPELRKAVAGEPGADPAVETGCPAASSRKRRVFTWCLPRWSPSAWRCWPGSCGAPVAASEPRRKRTR